jgi:hypothetical protein
MSQSIEPPAIDGKALQCGSFLTLYSEESKAQCLSTLSTLPYSEESKAQCLSTRRTFRKRHAQLEKAVEVRKREIKRNGHCVDATRRPAHIT